MYKITIIKSWNIITKYHKTELLKSQTVHRIIIREQRCIMGDNQHWPEGRTANPRIKLCQNLTFLAAKHTHADGLYTHTYTHTQSSVIESRCDRISFFSLTLTLHLYLFLFPSFTCLTLFFFFSILLHL